MNARLKLNLDRLTGTFDVDPSSSRIYSRDAAIDLIVHGFDENEVTPANEGGATPPGKPVVQFVNSAGRVVAQAMLVRPTGDGSGAGADGKYDLVATLSTNTVEMRREFFGVGLQAVREFTVRILDTETANPIACGPFPVFNFPGVFGDAPTELPSASEVLAELRRMIEEHAGRTNNPHRVTAALIEALTQVQADARYALKSSVTSLSSQVSQALNQSAMAAAAARGHAAHSDNPHGVTAEQVGAYTKDEINTRLDEKADKATTVAGYGITDAATKTEIAAKADLVGGKIPAAQLPSYVDDVLEYDTMSAFPATGESGKIYVAKDTNLVYRWSGTQYVEISPSPAFDNTVTETSQNGVKSSGIWRWVKSLLPSWITPTREEPPTQAEVASKYTKPSGGIPDTDMTKAVKTSLGLANTALQKHQDISGKLDKQHGNMSISWDDFYYHLNIKNAVLNFSLEPPGVLSGIVIGGNKLYSDEWYLSSTLNIYYKIKLLTGAQLNFLDNKGNEESIEDRIKRLSSLALEYSTSSAYSVGQYVFHDGSIYRCTTAIALPGEAWNPTHWSEAQKLDDFFTESNSLLTGTIESKVNSMFDNGDTTSYPRPTEG